MEVMMVINWRGGGIKRGYVTPARNMGVVIEGLFCSVVG